LCLKKAEQIFDVLTPLAEHGHCEYIFVKKKRCINSTANKGFLAVCVNFSVDLNSFSLTWSLLHDKVRFTILPVLRREAAEFRENSLVALLDF